MSLSVIVFVFFKQKTAYEMRISDWSSDVCSSDLNNKEIRVKGLDSEKIKQESIRFLKGEEGIAYVVDMENAVNASVPAILRERIVNGYNHDRSRSEERRVGKECVSTCRSRWSPYH